MTETRMKLVESEPLDRPFIAAFCEPNHSDDDDYAAELWRDYLPCRSSDSEKNLIAFYIPMVRSVVYDMRRKGRFISTTEEMISDGCHALLLAMRRVVAFSPLETRCRLAGAISQAIRNQWGLREKYLLKRSSLTGLRGNIYQNLRHRLGRNPSRDETERHLREHLKANPGLEFASSKPMSFSDIEDPEFKPRTFIDKRAETPDRILMRREAIDLATKGLAAMEREILDRRMNWNRRDFRFARRMCGRVERSVLAGECKLLWTLRSRTDLASALGVKPFKGTVPKNRRWEPRSILRCAPAELAD